MAKKFLSNFFEVTEKPLTKEEKPVVQVKEEPKTSFIPTSSSIGNTLGYTGKLDAILESIIEKENLPGPDVYELICSVKEMMSTGLAEDQAYRSAFTAFKSLGLTKERLIETSHHYIKVVDEVYNNFQTEVINKKQSDLDNLSEQRTNIMTQIEELTQKVRDISTECQEKSSEIANLRSEIDGSYNKTNQYFKNVMFKIENYL